MSTRTATVRGNGLTAERVARFLPSNYHVVGALVLDELTHGDVVDSVVISGEDNAGWTLDDYVIPRLASGLMFATEVLDFDECPEDCDGECQRGSW